jgi:hypothetical protein
MLENEIKQEGVNVDLKVHGQRHVKNVLLYSALIGQEVIENKSDLNLVLLAAKYHDVGRKTDAHEEHADASADIAVEKLKDFKMLHGQCVAVGSIAAMKLSSMRGNISETDVLFAEKCFKAFGLPIRVTELTAEDILKISKSDKKMEAGKIKFVLLHEIGNAYVDKTVSDEELLTVSEYILNE